MSQIALVTGASSGIGFELAKLCAADGYELILIARGGNKLQAAAEKISEEFRNKPQLIEIDLSDPAAPRKIFDRVGGRPIDVLINNAGFGTRGAFSQIDEATDLGMLQVNVMALTYLTKLFLPSMLKSGRGRILNVASTAAFQPGPFMAVYYASKAYVLSFSEALSEELRGTGITVTALCPGPTKTGFQDRADMTGTRLFASGISTARAVAQRGYAGMLVGKRVVFGKWTEALTARIALVAPHGLALRYVRSLQEKK